MKNKKITFSHAFISGNELLYINEVLSNRKLAGDGYFSKKCHEWLEKETNTKKALITHSGSAALEMAAILSNIKAGDEIIMPSYTFSSTANAFVLRGGVPVFVDIRKDTLNINETLIESAITPRTKAIVPVHYAGNACEMDVIMEIARKYNLIVIEDAAQGILSTYKGKMLGTIGHMGCYSFHESKNIISGEGGSLLINDELFIERAEIIREKGTNRNQFFKGQVDKYTWVDIGSSFLPGEVIAAFLYAQLQCSFNIHKHRLFLWDKYHENLNSLEKELILRRPILTKYSTHNAHMYYIILNSTEERSFLMNKLKEKNIYAVFHYIPLHSSPAGKRYGKFNNPLIITDDISNRILRLPLWNDMNEEIDIVIESIHNILK